MVSKIGYGYGSEWHLIWYLGRHRAELDRQIRAITGAESVEWLDFPTRFDNERLVDGEWKGLNFLEEGPVRNAWRGFWPQRAGVPTWDAVARLRTAGEVSWFLVEAKAHLAEIGSTCAAKPEGGLDMIRKALDETKRALGVDTGYDWLSGHYQFANRLATLQFLHSQHIPAKLLFIYFTGDSARGRECPLQADGWMEALLAQDHHLGLPTDHALTHAVHKLFLPAIFSKQER